MTGTTTAAIGALALAGAMALLVGTIDAQDAPAGREQMIALGRQHKTASDLYQALKAQAGGGRRLRATNLPDWSGVYTRARGGISYDPAQKPGTPPTAKLTPEFEKRLQQRIEMVNKGVEWDPIST